MSRQTKIRAGAPLVAALRATGDEFPTGRINAIAERYLTMIEVSRPALSRNEWMAIFDALSGINTPELVDVDHFGPRAWNEIVPEIASDCSGLTRRSVGRPARAATGKSTNADETPLLCWPSCCVAARSPARRATPTATGAL